jgi:LysR family glycine cleavage system transcriptional activator
MRRLPPLNWLKAFEAAARLLSFTAAARELNITQSAVSQQIRLLEAHLGQQLFLRRARGISLTEPANRLFPAIHDSLDRMLRAYTPLLSVEQSYTIWISANISFLILWLLPRIRAYQESHPFIDFRFNTTRWTTDPRPSGAGIDILYGDGAWSMPGECLTQNVLFPVCAPELARLVREPADLFRFDLITTHGEEHLWKEWAQAAGIAGRNPRSRYVVDLHMAALDLARRGHGVALANDLLAAGPLAAGQLGAPILRSIPAKDNYYLSIRGARGPGAQVSEFAQWLKLSLAAQARSSWDGSLAASSRPA